MDYYKLKYREYNSEFFKNRLPNDVQIRVRRFQKQRGSILIEHIVPGKPTNIRIYLGRLENEKQHLFTLKHEMCHLYQFIRGKKLGHDTYFWQLLKAIGGQANITYKKCNEVFGDEVMLRRREEVIKMTEIAEAKKKPGTHVLVDLLKEGPKTVEALAEGAGVAINTVKVQLSFHLKQKGYIIEKAGEGDAVTYQITGQGEPLPQKPKKAKKVKEDEAPAE